MLPNALQPDTTDHVPVLADEVRELLGVEPGDTVVDATFGAGGHAALLAADLRGDGRFVAIVQATASRRSGTVVPLGPLQGVGARARATTGVAQALRTTSYLPFLPPNVGGYPKGSRLLGTP